MFLDSGNIISDETFCTHESNYGGKVPVFLAESLCLRWGMATSDRWCHMTLLDHVTPTTKIQRIFKKHGVSTYHKPTNKLREILVKPKDKTPMEQQSKVVYQLKCDNCDKNVHWGNEQKPRDKIQRKTQQAGTLEQRWVNI